MISRDETPEAAILAVVSVVSHGKVIVRRDVVGTEVFVNAARVDVMRIRFLERLPVDINRAADHLQFFTGQSDESLDIGNFRAVGIFENDHITSLEVLIGKQFVKEPGRVKAVDKFVDQEVVTNQ